VGMAHKDVMRIYRTFNAASEPFRRESERQERSLMEMSVKAATPQGEGAP